MFDVYLVLFMGLFIVSFNSFYFFSEFSSKWNVVIPKFLSRHAQWNIHFILNPLVYKLCLYVVYTQKGGTWINNSVY